MIGRVYFFLFFGHSFEHINVKKHIFAGFSLCILLQYPAPVGFAEMKTSLEVVVCSFGNLSICVDGKEEGGMNKNPPAPPGLAGGEGEEMWGGGLARSRQPAAPPPAPGNSLVS